MRSSRAWWRARQDFGLPGPPTCWLLWLAWRELGVGGGRGEVGGGSLRGEADDGAVDVNPDRAVRGGLASGRVDAGEQVGPGGGQVKHDILVDLPRVEPFGDRLGGPQAQL